MKRMAWLGAIALAATGCAVAWWTAGTSAPASASRTPPPVAALTAAGLTTTADPVAVNGARAPIAPVRVRIQGEVIGLSSATAAVDVLVTAGDRTYPATVSGRAYSVEFLAPPDDMVSVEATSLRVRYRALLGSAMALKRRAGPDGILVPAELAASRVSPWSTAVAFFVQRSLDGSNPQSDLQLERARRSLASDAGWSLFESMGLVNDPAAAAHVLHKVAEGGIALPPGMADGYQLISDQAAYRAVLAQPGILAASLDYPFSIAMAPAVSTPPDQYPQRLLLASRMLSNDQSGGAAQVLYLYRTGNDVYRVEMSPLDAEVAGEAADPVMSVDYQARLDGAGDLVLLPAWKPVTRAPTDNGTADIRIDSITLRPLTEAAETTLWATRIEWTETYPDAPATPARVRRQVATWWGMDPLSRPLSLPWRTEGQRVGLPVMCLQPAAVQGGPRGLGFCETLQHRFEPAGRGVTENAGWKVDAEMKPQAGTAGAVFTWTLAADRSQMRIAGSEVTVDYRLIDEPGSVADLVFYRAYNDTGFPAGQATVGLTLAIKGDALPLSAPQVPGYWHIGGHYGSLSYPTGFADSYIVRNGDGTASDYLDENGLAGTATPSNWSLFDGRLYETRYRARYASGSLRYVQNCPEALASGAVECAAWRVRYFQPIARTGLRLYGYTDFYLRTQFGTPPAGKPLILRVGGGLAYYDCTQGGCR